VAYIQLTQAEAAFRIQKDQLAIRPIWHQREDRVQAHILMCFLAFVLWKTLELWQARAGLGNSPRTLLEELARIQAHDVILPTHTHGEIRLRCVTQPDAAQAALLGRLGSARVGLAGGRPFGLLRLKQFFVRAVDQLAAAAVRLGAHALRRSWCLSGSERIRFPVARKTALQTAGARGRIAGSP